MSNESRVMRLASIVNVYKQNLLKIIFKPKLSGKVISDKQLNKGLS